MVYVRECLIWHRVTGSGHDCCLSATGPEASPHRRTEAVTCLLHEVIRNRQNESCTAMVPRAYVLVSYRSSFTLSTCWSAPVLGLRGPEPRSLSWWGALLCWCAAVRPGG